MEREKADWQVSSMRVLNFGSLNLDYVYNVDHFVRPGETLAASSRAVKAGGKGLNQSVALARAGVSLIAADSGEEAAAAARRRVCPPLEADAPWMLGQIFDFDDHRLILLVNTDGEARSCRLKAPGQGRMTLLKPETGESEALSAWPERFSFTPWETLAVWID